MVPGEYVNGVNCTVLCITLLVAITLLGIQKAKSNIHMERMYTFYLLAVRDMYLCFQAYDVIVLILNLICQWMSQESYTKFSNPCQGEG